MKDNNNMTLKSVGSVWIGLIWLRVGTRAGTCESDNEP
jgi:hypothetical protein